jgi:hypothetical protein
VLELVRINFKTEEPEPKGKPYVIEIDGITNVSGGGPVDAILNSDGTMIYLYYFAKETDSGKLILSEALLKNANNTTTPQKWEGGLLKKYVKGEMDDNSMLGATLDKGTPSVFYQLKGSPQDIHYAHQDFKTDDVGQKIKWSENVLAGYF